jgi:hypothetical protein
MLRCQARGEPWSVSRVGQSVSLSFFTRFARPVAAGILFLSFTSAAQAQFETAAVLGYVFDSSGAPLVHSQVTLINTATGQKISAQTDGQGEYNFPDVKVGTYQIDALAPGFRETVTDPFPVAVNARQRVDVKLQVGSESQTVTVSGAATQLETDSTEGGVVIGPQEVQNLPLNGREYADLATLAPGVRRNNLENQTVTSRDASYNVNGQRSEFNDFLLDGLDNNAYGTSNQGFSNQAIPPSPDAINEFRVETNNYSAEYGRASGAVFNVSINSGTNKFHGKVWEYLRNTDLNAKGPFQAPLDVLSGKRQVPTLNRNQFGGDLGGPILKNKAFFFMDYEGNRQVQGQYETATIPNLNQQQGIFQTTTGAAVPLQNPITGTLYNNGIVPVGDWTPLAKLVIQNLPTPNVAGFANNYASFPKSSLVDDKGDIRIDLNFNPRTTAFGRYSDHQGNIVDITTIPGADGGSAGNGTIHDYNRQIVGGVTRSLTDNSLLDARIGFTWTEGGKTPYLAGQTSLNTQAGIPGLPTSPTVTRALSYEAVTDFTAWGAQDSNPQFQNPFVINPKVNYSILKGRNSIKTGWEFLAINTEIDDFNPVYGAESFGGAFSQNGGGTSDAGAAQAAYLTDFLTGARNAYQLNNFVIVNYHQYMNFFYVQDDIKVRPNLTINAGLRYELVTPQFVSGNHLANFDPSNDTLIQAKSGSLYNRALVHTPKLDFAPRFGVAYTVDPKTVIRSAYGISFDQFNREGGENLLAYNGPYIVSSAISPQYAPHSLLSEHQAECPAGTSSVAALLNCFSPVSQGYPTGFASSSNFSTLLAETRYIPSYIPTGYIQSWHLDVQREVAKNTVLTVSYVGEHGVHLWVLADLNQAAPCPATGACATVQARRPIPGFTTIEESIPAGFLSYNGLQTKLEHRFADGFYALNSFTWSRALDNASGHLDTPNNDNSRINLANPLGERGQSAYNQPLNETLSIVWDLPYGHGRHFGASAPRALDTLLGNWQFTAINTATSGQPVNLIYTINPAYSVSTLLNYRPNVSGNPVTPQGERVKTATSVKNFLSSTNVSIPGQSTPYGNAARNSLRDYPFYQLDIGLHKGFPLLNNGTLLDLRGEAFNVLNQVNYEAPDSNRSDSSYGTITTAFPARQLQVAAKLIF